MNKNILNLNNRVGVREIGAGRAIPVPAPLCIGFGESPPESRRGSRGRGGLGANCHPYLHPKLITEQNGTPIPKL